MFQVSLLQPPVSNVTISFSTDSSGLNFGFNKCQLTFTPNNWGTPQIIVVTPPLQQSSPAPCVSGRDLTLDYFVTYADRDTPQQYFYPLNFYCVNSGRCQGDKNNITVYIFAYYQPFLSSSIIALNSTGAVNLYRY